MKRPLAVSLFGAPEHVLDWDDTHAMAYVLDHSLSLANGLAQI